MKKYENSWKNLVVLHFYINKFNASQETFVMEYEDTPIQLLLGVRKKS